VPRFVTRSFVAALAAAAFAAGGTIGNTAAEARANAAAQAAVACDPTQTQPFLPWGDLSYYVLIPGGALETGSNSWRLQGGARLVPGNEPYHVHSQSDDESLSLPPGSSAQTNKVCIELLSPTLRFFVVNEGSPTSLLHLDIVFRDDLGNILKIAPIADLAGTSQWQPTLPLAILANVIVPAGVKVVQLRFTPLGTDGAWRIDDAYVDPWVSRQ
jgi:hypothetical protein